MARQIQTKNLQEITSIPTQQATNNSDVQIDMLTTHAPAHLWIGKHNTLVEQVHHTLQAFFCKQPQQESHEKKGCNVCIACTQIVHQQHHDVYWLYPEKLYTREQLAGIFRIISFKLHDNQHVFFIIQKADFLTPICANSLLKVLEEPPEGYHFLLLAQRYDQILPTIRSRCIIKSFYNQNYTVHNEELFTIFTAQHPIDPSAFLKIIEQSKINEREVIELLDGLLIYWVGNFKEALSVQNAKVCKEAQNKITILKEAIAYPPMPGSSKIVLKNLYLQIFL